MSEIQAHFSVCPPLDVYYIHCAYGLLVLGVQIMFQEEQIQMLFNSRAILHFPLCI